MLMCVLIILVGSLCRDKLHFIVSVFCNYGCQSYINYWPKILNLIVTCNFESRSVSFGGGGCGVFQKQIFLLQNCQLISWKSVKIGRNSQPIMNCIAIKQSEQLFIFNIHGMRITNLVWILWVSQVICFDEGQEKILVKDCNCSAESFNIVL